MNAKEFFENFSNFGVQFISIKSYLAKTTGELANYTINVGLSVENAKENDLKKLQGCSLDDLTKLSTKTGISIEICQTALSELIASAEKNLNPDITKRSAGSQAQTDAYLQLCKGIRMHKETMQIFIFGQHISKQVIQKGEYKTVNSSDKTLAKNAIKKYLNLTTDKFREFTLSNISEVKIQGKAIIFA
jgi:hypothetical protein